MLPVPPLPAELWGQMPPPDQAAVLALVQQYVQRLQALQQNVDDLRQRLNQNATSSSSPPSSDPPRVKRRPPKPSSGRKKGGSPATRASNAPCQARGIYPTREIVMPFSAECAFCRLTLQSVPDHRLGHSVECPRCHNCFTLAPKSQPEAAARIASASPPSAPVPRKVTLSPTGQQSSKSDSITAEKPLADPSTQPRLPPIEAQSVRDYFGVGSFSLGSYAFLTGALTHDRFLTLGLGLAGLLCGVIGLFLSLSKQQVSLFASAGLILSLPAVLIAVFVPDWLGIHLLG